jgi:hypothetical protein
MDSLDRLLETVRVAAEGKIDFVGQKRVEQITQRVLVCFGVRAFFPS